MQGKPQVSGSGANSVLHIAPGQRAHFPQLRTRGVPWYYPSLAGGETEALEGVQSLAKVSQGCRAERGGIWGPVCEPRR